MIPSFGEGAVLGQRYRLERILGSGGMASVWLAHDDRLARVVAVKILSDTLAYDTSYVGRFRREARLAAGLSHPNLVQVYDFADEDERPYLVMEHVPGQTLAERISDESVAELAPGRVAQELLGALDHIHCTGIIHRDIKPANVLIASDDTVKVTDFGIAQSQDATRLTSTGLVIGTRSYMAPEVLAGDPATVRSDLYGCARVLEEAFGDRLTPELEALVRRLGNEDPASRPKSASAALASLGVPGALDEASTAATAPLSTGRTAPTTIVGVADRPRLRPLLIGGLAAVVGTLVGGVLLLNGGDEPSSRELQQTSEAQNQSRSQTDAELAAPAEQTTVTETVATESTDAAKPRGTSEPDKVKPPKPPKFPPGKAKGLKKQ